MSKVKLIVAFLAGMFVYSFLGGDLLMMYLIIHYCRAGGVL